MTNKNLLFFLFFLFAFSQLFAQAPIITNPGSQTVNEGQTATFSVTRISGTEPFTYQWQVSLLGNGFDWTDVSGANNASYTTPSTTLEMDGIWLRCNVENDSGFVNSSHAVLTVDPAPPAIVTHPIDKNIVVGAAATFTVVAAGSEPLSYQWKKNNLDIAGANSASYETPIALISDDGSLFKCEVSNAAGSVISDEAILTVQYSPGRITEGLQVLYDFKEGDGSVINDKSGVGTPLNLTISNLSVVNWTVNGLEIIGSGAITSGGPATKIIDACKLTNELTVEAWIRPEDVVQGDRTTRIITLAENSDDRNFVVAQTNDIVNIATRTSNTDDGGHPGSWGDDAFETSIMHLVYTRASNGDNRLFVNGQLYTSNNINGDFSNWNSSYILGIGNEINDLSKAWQGSFYLVALYDKALDANEILHNFQEGVPLDTENPTLVRNPRYQGALTGESLEFRVGAVGKLPMTYQWQVDEGAGYSNITGATKSFYRTPSVNISYDRNKYRCVVANSEGTVTSSFASLFVTPSNQKIAYNKQLEYNFQEGSGNVINDVSVLGDPLNLSIQDPDAVEWTEYGLNILAPAGIVTENPAAKIIDASTNSHEFSFEAWIKPANSSLTSLSRIAAISSNQNTRNFYFAQKNDNFEMRSRTTINISGSQLIESPSASVNTSELTHIAYTINEYGIRKMFINGQEVNSHHRYGNITNWDNTFLLALGADVDNSYSWEGLFNYAAFYGRALSPTEIAHNYSFGPNGGTPEIISPTSLTAEAENYNKISLTWIDGSDNENGFIIEKSVGDSSSYAIIDSVSANATSYIDSNVSESNQYYYRLRSYNFAVTSDYSNQSAAITLLKEPTELSAQAQIFGQIILRWTENSDFESGIIIERGEGDPVAFSAIDTLQPNVNTYFDETVGDFLEYSYRIRAFNDSSFSLYSNVVTIKSVFSDIISPSDLSVQLHPVYGIPVLSWTDNSNNENGFVIERKIAGAEYEIIDSVDTDTTNYQDPLVEENTVYLYRVIAFNDNTTSNYSNIGDVSVLTGVENNEIPNEYTLSQNYPNPFNPSTTINFGLPQNSQVTVTLYNMLGQKVMDLIDLSLTAGIHKIEFDASRLTSGIYIYSIKAIGQNGNNFVNTKKMILLK